MYVFGFVCISIQNCKMASFRKFLNEKKKLFYFLIGEIKYCREIFLLTRLTHIVSPLDKMFLALNSFHKCMFKEETPESVLLVRSCNVRNTV